VVGRAGPAPLEPREDQHRGAAADREGVHDRFGGARPVAAETRRTPDGKCLVAHLDSLTQNIAFIRLTNQALGVFGQ